MTTQQKLKAGVIGTGGISGVHLANLKKIKSVKLISICDMDRDRALKVASEQCCKAYTSYEEMLQEELDMVFLFTPQMVREGPISICAKRKIPVFTEKPPASDLKTARKIETVIRKSRLTVSVGFMFRYLKIIEKVQQLLKGRPILALQLQYLCPMMYSDNRLRNFFYDRKASGGLVGDQAIHLLDLCRYLLNTEIEEVHAYGANIFHPKTKKVTTEETVTVNMVSKKGILISYLHTWVHRGWNSRVEIFAPDVRITLDLFKNKLNGVVDGKKVCFGPADDGYFSELKGFIDQVRKSKDGDIRSTYSDSVKTMALVAGVMDSIDKRKPVKLQK